MTVLLRLNAQLLLCATTALSATSIFAADNQTPPPSAPQATPATSTDPKTELKTARDRLNKSVKDAGLDEKRFQKLQEEFEQRSQTYWLSDQQMIDAYDRLNDVLSSPLPADCHFDKAQISRLIESAMHNLARPRRIDQGNHPTCNVTTVEVHVAARYPDRYADLIKQVALTGKWKSKKGDVTPPKKALMPGEEEIRFDIDKADSNQDRNHASQIMQMTLVNAVFETGGLQINIGSKNEYTDKERRYIMGKMRTRREGNYLIMEGEDLLVDKNGVKISDSPQFTQREVLFASRLILDAEMPYYPTPFSVSGGPLQITYPTKAELLKLKAAKELPKGIPTRRGDHVQTIHDVHVDQTGKCWVLIDNQNGESGDGWVTLDQLHEHMRRNDSQHKLKPLSAPAK